jgi:hypothetical protein
MIHIPDGKKRSEQESLDLGQWSTTNTREREMGERSSDTQTLLAML